MKLNPVVFREYDIRGIVNNDLTPDFANLLGRAYGVLAAENKLDNIVIGQDCRLTSASYAEALAEGLSQQGISSILTEVGPTPQSYFALFANNYGGAIHVTGSHNPSNMNGFKICLGKKTLSGSDIQQLRELMEKLNAGELQRKDNIGLISRREIRAAYTEAIIKNCLPYIGKRKLKIVTDAGNGVGGLVGPAVLRALGVEVIELFSEPDGRFPNHHPDPTEPHNLVALIDKVRSEGADFGIGWDGDADRIGVVDETGQIVFGDMLMVILSRQILKYVPGAAIVGDVKCSDQLFQDIERHGGKPIMWRTGHSLIKAKLKESGAELAGEMSGHIFFQHRYFGFDDAIYASARLAEILSNTDKPFSALLEGVKKTYSTPEIRVDCAEERKFALVEKLKGYFAAKYEVNTIDGVRVKFKDGWGLVRASNTQPVLVMRFEATSEIALQEYKSIVEQAVAQC